MESDTGVNLHAAARGHFFRFHVGPLIPRLQRVQLQRVGVGRSGLAESRGGGGEAIYDPGKN